MRKDKSMPWPDGKLHFIFDKDYPTKLKESSVKVMHKIEELIPCVKFVPADPVLLQTNLIHSYLVFTDSSSG